MVSPTFLYLRFWNSSAASSARVWPNCYATHAPTWLLHMPALTSAEDRLRLREEGFGTTRERMLREITDALDTLTAETPIVFALEDLHWSDASTIDLLSSIAGRSGPARLMIL